MSHKAEICSVPFYLSKTFKTEKPCQQTLKIHLPALLQLMF